MPASSRKEVLALIPARGGSKSIPRKNLIEIAGKPLIAHSIEQAKSCALVTRTVVSTDDAEIAEVAAAFAAEVPFLRPAEFAGDLSPDIDVFVHALTWLRDNEDYRCELVVHLRPTGPVRRVELIDRAIEMMLNNAEADSLRSVSPPQQTPYKMWQIEDGYLTPIVVMPGVAESYCLPRQTLPKTYWQNGYVDIIRSRTILDQGRMCGEKILPFPVNEPNYEIDYPEAIPAVERALLNLAQGRVEKQIPPEDFYPV